MEGRIINIDPEILGGTPVYYGTRVPIKNLFDHLDRERQLITSLTILKEYSGRK
jgi:uncharacterized protein (DUF433 family)